jgi:hypothetical protein
MIDLHIALFFVGLAFCVGLAVGAGLARVEQPEG